jgi:YjbE family integral membrane protein
LDLISYSALLAFVQVLMINIVLSGDNAIVIGMVAARVAPANRNKVIMWGMVAAVVLRLLLAVVAVDLLQVLGLSLAGGILLLWVAWRLYRDLREQKQEKAGLATISARKAGAAHTFEPAAIFVPLRRAIWQIAVADVSMSVDNVLAIAGAASDHVFVLIFGLVLSIALMGVAATYIAKLLQRFPALSYVGVLLIVYVAFEMIWDGTGDVPEILEFLRPARP